MFGISPIGVKLYTPSFKGNDPKVEEVVAEKQEEKPIFPEGTVLARSLFANYNQHIVSLDKNGEILNETIKPMKDPDYALDKLQTLASQKGIKFQSIGGVGNADSTVGKLKMAQLRYGKNSNEYRQAMDELEKERSQRVAYNLQQVHKPVRILESAEGVNKPSFIKGVSSVREPVLISQANVAIESGSTALEYGGIDGTAARAIKPPVRNVYTTPSLRMYMGDFEYIKPEKEPLMFAALTTGASSRREKTKINLKLTNSQEECAKGIARSIERSVAKNGELAKDTITSINSRLLRHQKRDPLAYGDALTIISASGYQVIFSTNPPVEDKFGKKGKYPQSTLSIYDPQNELMHTKKTYNIPKKDPNQSVFAKINSYFKDIFSIPSVT